MRKKILHLTNSSVKSNFLLSIAKLYSKSNYELFIGTYEKKGELHKELEKLNIPCISFNLNDERLGWLKIFHVFRYLKENDIEIVHVHTFWVSLFGLIAAKLAGLKIIMTRHHADLHILNNKKFHVMIDSFTAKFVDKVIAVSDFTKSIVVSIERVPENQVEVVYNGLQELTIYPFDEEVFLKKHEITKSDKILLCISRLHSEKDLETIVDAINILQRSDIHLFIAGGGLNTDYHKLLLTKLRDFDLESNVHFLGFRNDIKELMKVSNAVIHSSLSESFGFVIVEAMQQKTPIIATEIPALVEVATKNAAFFFPPKNSKKLSHQINHVLSLEGSPLLSKKLDFGLKRYQENFTFKIMMKKYEKLYESI